MGVDEDMRDRQWTDDVGIQEDVSYLTDDTVGNDRFDINDEDELDTGMEEDG